MSAVALKQRLRVDLRAAMQVRAADEVRLLRTLIAALDNAEAVSGVSDRYVPRAFGDPDCEVARRVLDDAAIDALLESEIEARRAASADYERHGEADEARRLRAEAERIARYRAA